MSNHNYQLYVIDENGHSSTWSHTEGHRGKPCMTFPDDQDLVIVLEHPSQTTHIYISPDGMLEVVPIEEE